VQVVALAGEDRVGPLDDLDVEVAAGPPPGPTSPSPVRRMRMPLSTPAGTLTVSVRPGADAPVAAALAARVLDDRAEAAAARAGAVVMTWPRNERCTCCTSPRPWQVSQVDGWVPGAVPWPVAGRADDGRLERELAVDAEGRLGEVALDADERVGALAHAAARPARAGAAAEEGVHDVAEAAEALRERRAGAAGPLDSGSPPRSTTCRFCGSDSTSYAAVTALKRSCASGSGLTSGAAGGPACGRPS
jgi:hypothetical protein